MQSLRRWMSLVLSVVLTQIADLASSSPEAQILDVYKSTLYHQEVKMTAPVYSAITKP
jgi:hypothetical protein